MTPRTGAFRIRTTVAILAAFLGAPTVVAGCADDTSGAGDADVDADAEAGPDPMACEPRATPLPLDEAPPSGEAAAGPVTSVAELIGGEAAYADVGKSWKLANDRVAILVQDGGDGTHIGYTIYGGSLLDADLQRDGPGQDVFREMFPVVGWRIPSANAMRVSCDGSGGRAAVLRVEGVDSPSVFISPIDALSPTPKNLRIVTEYILEPDTSVLVVRTTATNEGTRTLGDVGFGDVLIFGSTNTLFSPEFGFGRVDRGMPTWIATSTDPEEPLRNTSYAYATAHGAIRVPLSSSGITGGLGLIVPMRRGESVTFERYFSIGNGDVSSAAEPLLVRLGTPFAVVTGAVTGAGGPAADVAVVAFPSGSTAGSRDATGQAVTAPDGTYRLVVAPGAYDLVAAKLGHDNGLGETGTLEAGAIAAVDITLGAAGSVTLDVREDGAPAPAKVTFWPIDAEAPEDALGPVPDEVEPMGAARIVFTPDGGGTWPIKPGRYDAVVSRGPEYRFVEQEVIVPEDGTATLTATLDHLVDSGGWVAGDFHVHSLVSVDASASVCHRVLDLVVEGLDYAASTEHDGFADYAPCIESMHLEPWFNGMIGDEVSNMGTGGHRNAYPMPFDPDDPHRLWGPQYWGGLSAQELNDKLHSEPTDPVVQMNHPRSTDSYMNWVRFDPIEGTAGREPLATGYEAIETSNGSRLPFDDIEQLTAASDEAVSEMANSGSARDQVPLFSDYLSILRMGWDVTAMGTSDVHGRSGAGYARSYMRIAQEDPRLVTEEDVTGAVRAGRVVVSNGIFLRVLAEGDEAMGYDEVVPIVGSDVELYVQTEAVPGIDVSTLHVLANGRPLYLRRDSSRILAEESDAAGGVLALPLLPGDALDEVVRLATDVVHTPAVDTYYHVFVTGIGSMRPLPSSGPFAYTNAIFVDVDGGGFAR